MENNSKLNAFKETIFYKKDSELEYQIKALEKLSKKYPKNNDIKEHLKICKLSLEGEENIEIELKSSNLGMYIIRDLNVDYKDIKAQIQYIVITPGFIYILDSRNMYGNIEVNERVEFFRRIKKEIE